MIELQNIHVIFNKGTRLENHVLKGIDLKVEEGEFVTIIGGNGAGKSTLMNILAGDITPNKGKINIDGNDITKLPTYKRANLIARIFQDPMLGTFADLTIEENLSLACRRGKSRRINLALNSNLREHFKSALAEVGIGLERRLKDKVSLLSGGQRQALSLVMATMQDSKILLLDEHTAALDPKIAKSILEMTAKVVKNHKLTAIMITHSMTQALEYGNRTIMMYHGKINKDMNSEERALLSPDNLLKFFDL